MIKVNSSRSWSPNKLLSKKHNTRSLLPSRLSKSSRPTMWHNSCASFVIRFSWNRANSAATWARPMPAKASHTRLSRKRETWEFVSENLSNWRRSTRRPSRITQLLTKNNWISSTSSSETRSSTKLNHSEAWVWWLMSRSTISWRRSGQKSWRKETNHSQMIGLLNEYFSVLLFALSSFQI